MFDSLVVMAHDPVDTPRSQIYAARQKRHNTHDDT